MWVNNGQLIDRDYLLKLVDFIYMYYMNNRNYDYNYKKEGEFFGQFLSSLVDLSQY